tara:strand:- start:2425 stop:2601 length:177 start_codon:yes stop_codon:yes gene_type:complete
MEVPQTFAEDFFNIVNNSITTDTKDHSEWLLREYAKLLKRELEVKKKERNLQQNKMSD